METKVIFQDNAITKGKYNLSSMAKDVFLMLLSQLKKEDTKDKNYFFSVKELAELKGVTRLRFEEVDSAINELRNSDIVIISDDGKVIKSKFVAAVGYIKGTGIVELEISKMIRPYFIDLKDKFTAFQLKMALSLNSVYAKRLYEVLSMDAWKKKETYTVTEIKDWFNLNDMDEKTGKAKLTQWSDFERVVLKHSQKLISENTDISFTYEAEALMGGKAKSHITFYIQKKNYQEKIRFEDINNELYPRLVGEFKLSKKQALQIMETMTEKEIRQKFHQIKTSVKNIATIGGYSAKVFGV